jgi:glycosyltransferase involved in cell wall biosynthesis
VTTTRAKPRISVVIPAHNRAWALPACLDSVLGQTWAPSEVLVVDDRSTDDTAAVVARYAARGVRCARLERGAGAQAARNHGIELARGDWIAFQDSDDRWLPRKLELQCAALQALGFDPNCVVHGNGLRREEATGRTSPLVVPLTQGDCHTTLLLRPGPLFPALLASRTALLEAGKLDDRCPAYQEWDTALRLSQRCRFVQVQEPLFEWVWHAQQTMSKEAGRSYRGYRFVVERWGEQIERRHGAAGLRRQWLSVVTLAMRAGLWEEALAIIDNRPRHTSLSLARWFAQRRWVPPGSGRVLRLLAA